jgi:hypothetical protein
MVIIEDAAEGEGSEDLVGQAVAYDIDIIDLLPPLFSQKVCFVKSMEY